LEFFPLNFQFFNVLVREFLEFFPLNFQFFQCFCKEILDKFPFKNEKFNPQFRPKNEKFTPSIFACKMSRGPNKKYLKVILTSNRMRILRASQTPQRLRKSENTDF